MKELDGFWMIGNDVCKGITICHPNGEKTTHIDKSEAVPDRLYEQLGNLLEGYRKKPNYSR